MVRHPKTRAVRPAAFLRTLEVFLSRGSPSRALHCKACPLYKVGTQTVFGEGPRRARILLVGEQPGDQEDRRGRLFIGPAGRLLDRALEEAGIDRAGLYVTNAVKHFKWRPADKRRLHQKPTAREIAACHPWLEAEMAIIKPEVVIALGATAAQALIGKDIRVTQERRAAHSQSAVRMRILRCGASLFHSARTVQGAGRAFSVFGDRFESGVFRPLDGRGECCRLPISRA